MIHPREGRLTLLPSRLYCRLRNRTGSAFRLAGYTAGRESHPALKNSSYSIHRYYIPRARACQPPDRTPGRHFGAPGGAALRARIDKRPGAGYDAGAGAHHKIRPGGGA